MNPVLAMQMQAALEAVRIRSATSFSWFGSPSPDVPRTASLAMTPEDKRNYLCHQLQLRLYSDFYTKGAAAPGTEPGSITKPTSGTLFVTALSEANAGTGAREGGWTVVDVDGDLVTVARDGLQVWVTRNEIYADLEGDPSPGQTRAVRFPKELLKLSPGFYLALGNEGLAFLDGRILVRFYLHLRAEDAPRLMRLVTKLLNGERIPFRFKALDHPAQYDRCDGAVLYVERAHYERVLPIIRRILTELGPRLGKSTPVFTKALAPGLGLAEQPVASGGSFGMDRCRLVAEAIVRIYERDLTTMADRLDVLEEVFAEDGVTLATPYLNPGSVDRYDL